MKRPPPLTPDMKQYHEFKAKHPGYILLFRMGDFYEMFYDDATTAARVLGITLIARGSVPMAGVPYHAVEGYLRKMIAAGHRCAICEQVGEVIKTDKPAEKIAKCKHCGTEINQLGRDYNGGAHPDHTWGTGCDASILAEVAEVKRKYRGELSLCVAGARSERAKFKTKSSVGYQRWNAIAGKLESRLLASNTLRTKRENSHAEKIDAAIKLIRNAIIKHKLPRAQELIEAIPSGSSIVSGCDVEPNEVEIIAGVEKLCQEIGTQAFNRAEYSTANEYFAKAELIKRCADTLESKNPLAMFH